MKIIADKDIPFVEHYFGSSGDLILTAGRELRRDDLLDADILLVRSITKVNKELLHGTKIKFVASPTTGKDHFDTEWLDQVGIQWSVAPGCNAVAVVEYVICAIAALQKMGYLTQKKPRAGVVGVGKIGSGVAEKLKILGFDVVQCDPLRAQNEKDFLSTPIDEFADLDLITLHTPLTYSGPYPTYHLIEQSFLQRQKKNGILMNTGRGSVINFNDLKIFGEKLLWSLDVWENEPWIDFEVLDRAVIATPHIAGYTIQSKHRGIEMVHQAAVQKNIIPNTDTDFLKVSKQTLSFAGKHADWRDVVLKIYDPYQTTQSMKEKIIENDGKSFDALRKKFIDQDRYEFNYIYMENVLLSNEDKLLLERLGVRDFN